MFGRMARLDSHVNDALMLFCLCRIQNCMWL